MNLENKKQILIILAACLLGLIAAIGTAKVIETKLASQRKALEADYEKNKSIFINEMEGVRREMQAMATKQNAIAKRQEELASRPQVTTVQKPDQQQIEDTSFSLKTPPGKRAMTILIDSLSAVGGLINPGDYIDIIAQLNAKETDSDKTKKVTTVLMQNIQVLAIGTNFQPIGNSLVYVAQQRASSLYLTLSLSPEETALITFAQANGKLQLSLRSPSEQKKETLQVASWETLSDYVLERQGTKMDLTSGVKKIEESAGKEEVAPQIEIYRGGQEL